MRDFTRAGSLDLLVLLKDGRIIARHRIEASMIDAVETGIVHALPNLRAMLADPPARCSKTGDDIVVT
jgi:hypothetical protein